MLLPIISAPSDVNLRGLAALVELFSITGVVHVSLPLPADDNPAEAVKRCGPVLTAPASSLCKVVVGPLPGTPAGTTEALHWLDAGAHGVIVHLPSDGRDAAADSAALQPFVDTHHCALRVFAGINVAAYGGEEVARVHSWCREHKKHNLAGVVLFFTDPAWLRVSAEHARELQSGGSSISDVVFSPSAGVEVSIADVVSLHKLGIHCRALCSILVGDAGSEPGTGSLVPSLQTHGDAVGAPAPPLRLGAALAACVRSDREDGLFTTVVCDERGMALGLVYSSAASVEEAIRCRRGVYYSRSRGGLWRKGDTSGAHQTLVLATLDCDSDALLFRVVQVRGHRAG